MGDSVGGALAGAPVRFVGGAAGGVANGGAWSVIGSVVGDDRESLQYKGGEPSLWDASYHCNGQSDAVIPDGDADSDMGRVLGSNRITMSEEANVCTQTCFTLSSLQL